MMGQSLKSSAGGTLLVWSALVLFLISVALPVSGFPYLLNDSLSHIEDTSTSVVDDLALSSEEELEDEETAPAGFQPGLVVSSHPSDLPFDSTAKYWSVNPTSSERSTRSDASLLYGQSNAPSPGDTALRNGRSGSFSESSSSLVDNAITDSLSAFDKTTRKERPVMGMLTERPVVKLTGISIDYDSDKRRVTYDEAGSAVSLEGLEIKLTLYGKLLPKIFFRFSKFERCDNEKNLEKEYLVNIVDDDATVGIVNVKLPDYGELNEVYLCLRPGDAVSHQRQGEVRLGESVKVHPWLVIKLNKSMFPLYLHLLLIVVLLMLSGLFSGLNLGLMSLDKTDLKIIINTGSQVEKNYAQSIAPVRDHGNFLLCCLLFSNVLVNATLTILVDDLTTGLIAIAGSTLAIVIFGEIIPQAICSRYGLAVGARTIYITKFFMLLTSPLAFPLSILLDKILGEEIGNIYTRERLKELLKVTKDHHGLETEEVGIISGALDLKLKLVKDVMVRLDQIFMLEANTVLDFDTMAEIEYQGYSRIPVYDGDRSNVVALINVRQLTMLDASDAIPLRTVMEYYKTNLFFVFENTRLDYMFKAFREGSRGHMAFVQRVNDDGPGDPYYETVGMLTMEDVLEEILQADIRDENDVGKQNARLGNTKRPTTKAFVARKKIKRVVEIPATLALAATQYMSTSVDPFKQGRVSVTIIQRILKANIQFLKAPKRKARQQVTEVFLYEAGKAADSFTMILEGRVQVTVGKERLTYEAGPFNAFGYDFLMMDHHTLSSRTTLAGESALNSPTEQEGSERPSITSEMTDLKRLPTFVPDYSVKLLTDVYFFQIKYDHYLHAVAASDLERAYSNDPEKSAANAEWQNEIDKVLGTGDDDDESKTDPKAGGEPEIKRDFDGLIISHHDTGKPEDKHEESSTTTTNSTTESDESDNKDSDQDENHPNEQTKLLQGDVAIS